MLGADSPRFVQNENAVLVATIDDRRTAQWAAQAIDRTDDRDFRELRSLMIANRSPKG